MHTDDGPRAENTQYGTKGVHFARSTALLYGVRKKKRAFHFTWDIIPCNSILVSRASANCNSQAGVTSVGTGLLEGVVFFLSFIYIFRATL